MRTIAVLSEGGLGCPGKVEVALQQDGSCLLVFHGGPEGFPRSFPCTLPGLLDVALGEKKQLHSNDGSCLLSRGAERIIASVAPRGQPHVMLFFSREVYADALMSILVAKASRELVLA